MTPTQDGSDTSGIVSALNDHIRYEYMPARARTAMVDAAALITTLEQQNRELRGALESAPCPSSMGTAQEHYQRFYTWLKNVAQPALSTGGRDGE